MDREELKAFVVSSIATIKNYELLKRSLEDDGYASEIGKYEYCHGISLKDEMYQKNLAAYGVDTRRNLDDISEFPFSQARAKNVIQEHLNQGKLDEITFGYFQMAVDEYFSKRNVDALNAMLSLEKENNKFMQLKEYLNIIDAIKKQMKSEKFPMDDFFSLWEVAARNNGVNASKVSFFY